MQSRGLILLTSGFLVKPEKQGKKQKYNFLYMIAGVLIVLIGLKVI
ncbi:hypothetical protein [Lacticaseibacillus paracasei]|nr:hypothetical protein [Lacticaseibacillus paracasei]